MADSGIVNELRRMRAEAGRRAATPRAGTSAAWAAFEIRLGLLVEQLDPAPRGQKREEPAPAERCNGLDYVGQSCRHKPSHHGGCEPGAKGASNG